MGACYICGDSKHYKLLCPLRKHRNLLVCANGESSSHVERACRFKTPDRRVVGNGQERKARHIASAKLCDDSASDSSTTDPSIESIYKDVCKIDEICSESNKILVHLLIDGKAIEFRIDTGADVSLLNSQSWESLEIHRLSASQGRIRNASGKVITFKEICARTVQFGNSLADIQFYAKERVETNLLGMDWIRKVGLATTCIEFLKILKGPAVLTVEEIAPLALNMLLYKFSDIFQDNLERCNETASIQVRRDADLKIIPFKRPLIKLQKTNRGRIRQTG